MSMKLYNDSSIESVANSIRNLNNNLYNKGYTRIEYIQNSGVEYIDTGVVLSNNIDFEMCIKLNDNSTIKRLFGAMPSTSTRYEIFNGSRGFSFNYNVGTTSTDLDISGIKSIIKKEDLTFSINNRTFQLTSGDFTTANGYIFSSNRENPTNAVFKLYYLKIYNRESQSLVRNFVPCFRNSDNVIGLYDLVNNLFYTNQGTGNFTGGSEYPKYKIGDMAGAINEIASKINNSN